jgi:L-ribulose-5-phosphate 3-epimerase
MQRRVFLKNLGLASAGAALGETFSSGAATSSQALRRFKLGSITDEWTPDFESALKAMKRYGLAWAEIRTVGKTYITEASKEELRKMKRLLFRYRIRISVVDSALFKCVLPGTVPIGGEKDAYPYSAQMDLLKRALDRAHFFGTAKIRVFAFWRAADNQRHFDRIAEELRKAADVAHAGGGRLVLENESECNVATGAELARMLELVPAANFGANWDIGNGYWQGEVSFPDGYRLLPKHRIWHMHLKDVRCDPGLKKCNTVVVGTGQVDLAGQIRALLNDRYEGTMSLEPEVESPEISHLEATKRSLEALIEIMDKALARETKRAG